MESVLISTISVASAEIGDKTQLLALLLASRFRKPIPIILGILVATLINHAIAGILGECLSNSLTGKILHWVLAASFITGAVWILIPDKLDFDEKSIAYQGSIFFSTAIAFFLAEIGDKTQIATMLLAAQFKTLIPVVLGTTSGILIANIPIVLLGHKATQCINVKTIRIISAIIFFLLGILELTR